LKETTSIKIDKKDSDKIEGFLELPDLGFNSKSDFANKAIQEKIEKINSELSSQDDHRHFYHQIENLTKKMNKIEKELKYFKKEYDFEEKYEKHGKLEKAMAKHRREDPELMKLLDKWEAKGRKAFDEYGKKQFMKDGSTEQDWKDHNEEVKKTIEKYKKTK